MPDNVRRMPGAVVPSAPTLPETIILLRQRLDLARASLGAMIGRSTPFMRALETEQRVLSPDDTASLTQALRVPPDALSRAHAYATDLGGVFHATRTPNRKARQILANANLTADAITHLLSMDGVVVERPDHLTFPHIPAGTDALGTARLARTHLMLGSSPITHLAELMERCGCLIVPQTAATRNLAAYTLLTPERLHGAPFVFLDTTATVFVQRFALARELGRILNPDLTGLKRTPSHEVDMRLDTFALEFLAPAASIGDSLDGVTPGRHFAEVTTLQHVWGVTALDLLTRARDMGAITERQRVEWADTVRGRIHDLTAHPVPHPVVFHTLNRLLSAIANAGWSPYVLAGQIGLREDEVADLLPGWFATPTTIPGEKFATPLLRAVR